MYDSEMYDSEREGEIEHEATLAILPPNAKPSSCLHTADDLFGDAASSKPVAKAAEVVEQDDDDLFGDARTSHPCSARQSPPPPLGEARLSRLQHTAQQTQQTHSSIYTCFPHFPISLLLRSSLVQRPRAARRRRRRPRPPRPLKRRKRPTEPQRRPRATRPSSATMTTTFSSRWRLQPCHAIALRTVLLVVLGWKEWIALPPLSGSILPFRLPLVSHFVRCHLFPFLCGFFCALRIYSRFSDFILFVMPRTVDERGITPTCDAYDMR